MTQECRTDGAQQIICWSARKRLEPSEFLSRGEAGKSEFMFLDISGSGSVFTVTTPDRPPCKTLSLSVVSSVRPELQQKPDSEESVHSASNSTPSHSCWTLLRLCYVMSVNTSPPGRDWLTVERFHSPLLLLPGNNDRWCSPAPRTAPSGRPGNQEKTNVSVMSCM